MERYICGVYAFKVLTYMFDGLIKLHLSNYSLMIFFSFRHLYRLGEHLFMFDARHKFILFR